MKIHLIWLGGDPNRRTFKCIESVLRVHQTHDVQLWSDTLANKPLLATLEGKYSNITVRNVADIDVQARATFDFVYTHLDHGHQFPYSVFTLLSDMYRLIILQNEGGVYLDSDIYCLKDVTALVSSEDLYIGEEVHNGSAMGTNGVLGASSPGNRRLLQMIERGKSQKNINDWGFLGPKLVTEFFNAHCNTGGVSLIKNDALFPVCRFTIHRKLERHPARTVLDYEVTDDVFGVHIYDQIYGWTNHVESDFRVTVFPSTKRASRRPVLRPRLHLLSSPATISNAAFDFDDISAKTRRFARMMSDVGYEVYHYGVEGADTGALKQVPLITRSEWEALPGLTHRSALFNQRLVDQLPQNLACHRDIICLPLGIMFQGAVHSLNIPNPVVEIGVCYGPEETFSPFKIFHSYATYHQFIHKGRGVDHYWVIPSFYDVGEWEVATAKGRYLLFYGDYSEPNGGEVVDFIARARPDLKILACGPSGNRLSGTRPPNVEFISLQNLSSLQTLFAGALAAIVPTRALGHFESAAVQAMLTGTPVLGSAFGSLPEIVVPGSTGFLCHNLAEYLEGIMLIEQGKISRSEIARYAREKYDMRALARAYDVALQNIHDSGDSNWDGSWRP